MPSRPGSRATSATQRPPSSRSLQSPTAWDEGTGAYDNPGMQDERPDSVASFGEGPAPMEDEQYDPQVQVEQYQQPQQQQSGCWYKFKKGVRSLWATRQTEETEDNKELHVKTTLRELVIYFVFLIILCVVTFGMTSPTMYYYTKVMSDLFLDSQFPDTKNTFRGMTTMHDFWRFAESPMVDGLFWEKWYNNANVSAENQGYIFYENKLLGVARLRQLKVKADSCTVHTDFKDEINNCYDTYAKSIEDKATFGPGNNTMHAHTAFQYKTEEELDGLSHWGLISSYGGGGFVQNLDSTMSESRAIVAEMKSHLWLDRGTRAVFLDFTVYNANINLFCVVRLLVEFPATGGAIPSWNFRTVKLIRYVTVTDYFVLACECIFTLFILYYSIEEIIEIKKHKLSYFKSFWNILDVLVIMISLICIIFNIYRTLAVSQKLDQLLANPNIFPDFEFLSYWQTQFNSAIAITVFMAWVKVFKYISFNKTMTQLSSTLARCAKDLAGFAVMFFIIFLAFAQLGYLIFGTQVRDFSSFDDAVFTLFRIILGDFNFHQLESANRVLGPIYFILYVFFVFFVLLNMFLAIINDTYSEVKADIANQKSEFEMADLFREQYHKMKSKFNFKREKIIDIQKAIQDADQNKDQVLDFDEWRVELKKRGYADPEIEAVFSKYDSDGDRILDKSEQENMQKDLEEQKNELKKQFEDMEEPREGSGDESDDDFSGTKSSRTGRAVNGVSYEEFTVLSRRVDRMEHSIGSIVSKIDAVLVKLEAMERAKSKRRETMTKILDSITQADGSSDEAKREQMEKLVREELERWDSESSIGNAAGRGPSPGGSSGRSGQRPRSRPNSSAANQQPDV